MKNSKSFSVLFWTNKAKADNNTVYIAPVQGESNGESMTLNIPSDGKLDVKTLKAYLYKYLTDAEFKKEAIQGNENYIFIALN